jgi:hypothetical protein
VIHEFNEQTGKSNERLRYKRSRIYLDFFIITDKYRRLYFSNDVIK